jgi:hypothetical protein
MLAGSAKEMLAFLGDMTITSLALFRLKAPFRASDLFLLIQQCGAQARPIVTLISFLVGVILAFVGAVQLEQFGAQIYVADLVGIAMMTGIIMAGRTGTAFAAQLGTPASRRDRRLRIRPYVQREEARCHERSRTAERNGATVFATFSGAFACSPLMIAT